MEPRRQPRPLAKPVNRLNELASIHIRAEKVGLIVKRKGMPTNDDAYRDFVRTMSNGATDSAGKLDHTQRAALIAHLDKLERAYGLHKGPPPRWRKLRALWSQLHADGLVAANDEAAMNAWSKGQAPTCPSSARWADDATLDKLIESAKKWLKRRAP